MGKDKPRHNPDKPQNNYGGDYECPNYDTYSDGREFCHDHFNIWWKHTNGELICKGNLHNCDKMKRKFLASLSDKERQRFIDKFLVYK